jgi:hypothetical protein
MKRLLCFPLIILALLFISKTTNAQKAMYGRTQPIDVSGEIHFILTYQNKTGHPICDFKAEINEEAGGDVKIRVIEIQNIGEPSDSSDNIQIHDYNTMATEGNESKQADFDVDDEKDGLDEGEEAKKKQENDDIQKNGSRVVKTIDREKVCIKDGENFMIRIFLKNKAPAGTTIQITPSDEDGVLNMTTAMHQYQSPTNLTFLIALAALVIVMLTFLLCLWTNYRTIRKRNEEPTDY